jgi:hypothetical protein
MNKILMWVVLLALVLLGVGWFVYAPSSAILPAPTPDSQATTTMTSTTTETNNQPVAGATDFKNATYTIDGMAVKLKDGMSETPSAPGSASMITTKYFGNELTTDLNDDGRPDIVFLLTQENGGSGTFFYVVAALNTPTGYIGSDGYLLGDRIAPQTTELSKNPKQIHVVVVNYMDRATSSPMSTKPSIGKSAYLKLGLDNNQWGVVEPNFAGESGKGGPAI